MTDQPDARESPNAATIAAQAMPPDSDFGSRWPKNALMTKPASGSSGMSASISVRLPFQCRKRVRAERLAVAEQRDHQRQAHGRLGGRDGHDEEGDDLSVDRAPVAADGDERQVDGVEHDLDGEQHRDQVAPQEHAGGP